MRSVAELAGCRFIFDNFASKALPLCSSKTFKKYWGIFKTLLLDSEQKTIINRTGCLVPCTYREYKYVQNPLTDPSYFNGYGLNI